MNKGIISYKIISLNSILSRTKNEETVIVWGLSIRTKEILRKGAKVDFIIDKNTEICGSNYDGIPIIPPTKLEELKEAKLFLCGNHIEEILFNIQNLNLENKIFILEEDLQPYFKITKDYFDKNHSIESKKELFKNLVKHIEIEPHSYCNRTCWFCPNSFIDRKRDVKLFDKEILIKLLNELQTINYDGQISFTRYSEPFGNNYFYEMLSIVKKSLPNSFLHANTNSDFLNNKTLQKAYDNGLRSLFVQIYLDKDEAFNFTNIDKKAQKIINLISDVKIELDFIKDDWIEYKCIYKDMKIRMYARDFTVNGTNRAGLEIIKKKTVRTSPCFMVFTDIYIDYNGNIVPCCNIRSDNLLQKNYVIGNIQDYNSILELYFCDNFLNWRKNLFNLETKKIPPCLNCSFNIVQNSNLLANHLFTVNKSL